MKQNLQIEFRNQLPSLLNRLGLTGIGAEIGVQRGRYSEVILKLSKLGRLYSIDCWKSFSGYEDIANKSQLKQYLYYLQTIFKLRKFKKRSIILRAFSEDAVKKFPNESLDFVYIDAQHSYDGCKKDVELWWPKLKKGGIFAGHDYLNAQIPEGNFGVKKAIGEFAKKHGQKLFTTKAQNGPDSRFPSWYLIKK